MIEKISLYFQFMEKIFGRSLAAQKILKQFCLEPLFEIFGKKNMFLGFRMRFTGIYRHQITTKLNIHQGPL